MNRILAFVDAKCTWKEEGHRAGVDMRTCGFLAWYADDVKKTLTITEFARMGGKARAQKLTKQQLSAIGRKGGRPRLDNTSISTPNR